MLLNIKFNIDHVFQKKLQMSYLQEEALRKYQEAPDGSVFYPTFSSSEVGHSD